MAIFTIFLILGGALLLDKPELENIPPTSFLDSGITNPNLKVAKSIPENNQIVYYEGGIQLGPTQEQSSWSLTQWNTVDILYPENAKYNGEKYDALFGYSRMHMKTHSTALTIYDNPYFSSYSHFVYELTCMGGTGTAEGGKNLFLSTEFPQSFPVHPTLMASLNFKIIALTAQGEPPANVGQFFMGFIFQCNNTGTEGDIDTIFIQMMIANTNEVKYYAAGNPGVTTGVFARPIPEGLQSVSDVSAGFSHTQVDLTRILEEALPLEYVWVENSTTKSKTYSNTNPLNWELTALYVGLETQGDTVGIVQLTDFLVQFTTSNYFKNRVVYSVFFYIGSGGVGLSTISLYFRDRINKLTISQTPFCKISQLIGYLIGTKK